MAGQKEREQTRRERRTDERKPRREERRETPPSCPAEDSHFAVCVSRLGRVLCNGQKEEGATARRFHNRQCELFSFCRALDTPPTRCTVAMCTAVARGLMDTPMVVHHRQR